MKLLPITLALLVAGLVGCSNGCKVNDITAVGSYQTASGTWSVGITITFRALPTAKTEFLLRDAGAVALSRTVFTMPTYDRTKKAHNLAVEAALKEQATLTAYKPLP
jgi:hypothetical protein